MTQHRALEGGEVQLHVGGEGPAAQRAMTPVHDPDPGPGPGMPYQPSAFAKGLNLS